MKKTTQEKNEGKFQEAITTMLATCFYHAWVRDMSDFYQRCLHNKNGSCNVPASLLNRHKMMFTGGYNKLSLKDTMHLRKRATEAIDIMNQLYVSIVCKQTEETKK